MTAAEIHRVLVENQMPVTKRTVERDLAELSTIFPLETSPGKPKGWYWSKCSLMGAPAHDPVGALSFVLAGDVLRQLLPVGMHKTVDDRLRVSKDLLSNIKGRHTTWPQLVRYMPLGQSLMPPKITDGVFGAVEQALLNGQQLKVRYKALGSPAKDWVLHPLAILVHGVVPYLIFSKGEKTEIRQFPLQRFLEAEVIDEPAWRPAKFSIDSYLASGSANFGAGEMIELHARVSDHLAQVLQETPLEPNQTLTCKNGQHRLKVCIRNSWELEFWILSQADRMTVIKPTHLRDKLKGYIVSTLANYQ